jgi:RimJ/RimL family protein N-acetyltransferase
VDYPNRVLTDRLELRAIDPADAEDLFAIFSDPAGWWYDPTHRHADLATTRTFTERAAARWPTDRLSYWTARRASDGVVVGLGGAQRHRSGTWNLNYRIDTAHQGHGYATELARAAQAAATAIDPGVAFIAWVAPHNTPSRAVAERLGLHDYGLRVDASDGQPRLAFADRALDGEQFPPIAS